jgi:hypothetical protein
VSDLKKVSWTDPNFHQLIRKSVCPIAGEPQISNSNHVSGAVGHSQNYWLSGILRRQARARGGDVGNEKPSFLGVLPILNLSDLTIPRHPRTMSAV